MSAPLLFVCPESLTVKLIKKFCPQGIRALLSEKNGWLVSKHASVKKVWYIDRILQKYCLCPNEYVIPYEQVSQDRY